MRKTLTFGVMHIGVAFLVIWLMTGDWRIGGITALIEPLINTFAYHLHERIWQKHGSPRAPVASASAPAR